jgi:hypothetical protein
MENWDSSGEISPGRLGSFRNFWNVGAIFSLLSRGKGVANGTVTVETPSVTQTKRRTATRRLCAGAYLNHEFRSLLLEVYNCRKRRVAPSYGYDLAQVLRYGWQAWRLELTRDAMAVSLAIVALLTVPLRTLLVIGLLGVWYALRLCWRVLIEWIRVLRAGKSLDRVRGMKFRTRVAGYWLGGSGLVVVGAVLAIFLSPSGSWLRGDPAQAEFLIAGFILLFVVTGTFRHWQLVRLHYPSTVEGRLHSRRLRTIVMEQYHPVTVYSGYRPFIGSGHLVGQWSFAQRLVYAKKLMQEQDKEFPPSKPPFTTSQIVDRLKESITKLASISHSETKLPGLTVRDRIFIEGTYVNEAPKDLLDFPSLSPDSLEKIMRHPREEVRHHIECQIQAWDGEIVTTVFVHISLQGRTLYVEFSTYALTPTPPQFRVIDEARGAGFRAALRMVVHDLWEMPDVLHAPRRLMAMPKRLVNACWAQWPARVREDEYRDIGAQISVREIAGDCVDKNSSDTSTQKRSHADQEETNYYQVLDVFRHSKIIERRLFATIEAFLKEKGVDTSEFARRAEAILNNGVINTGSGGVNIGDKNVFGYQPSVSGHSPSTSDAMPKNPI